MQQGKPLAPYKSQKEIAAQAGYLTTAEAAKRAGVNVTTIYRLIAKKKIDAVSVGQQRYVVASSLAAHYGAIKAIHDRIMKGIPGETSSK